MIYKTEVKISSFLGLNTQIEDIRELGIMKMKDGSFGIYSPDEMNWLTLPNNKGIELRRGTKRLGTTDGGVGKVTGLGIGKRFDGTEIPFFSFARKVKYYDADTDDVVEVGSDMLPVAASGEDLSIFPYDNLAGAFVYLSSPNSSVYKIPVANPGSAVDQNKTTYRGFLKFGQARSFLFNRHGTTAGNIDKLGLYLSKVDKVDLSQYPAQVTGEVIGTGDGTTKTFTNTLVQRTGVRTVMYVVITDSVETFTDDRNGNLVGSAGGTGTINYATGAISITFAVAPTNLQSITAAYYYEDATSGGVMDFAIANPSARVAGDGNYFPQFDGGGNLNSVFPLATVFYCFHDIKTWQVTIPVDDGAGTDSIFTNLPFREKMGVKSQYGAFGGSQAIYFLNTADPSPEFMALQLYTGATSANIAAPKSLSDALDLSGYNHDNAVVFEWNDYVMFGTAQIRNGVADVFNSRMFVRNKINGAWDLLDYAVTRLADYMGTLIAGDPLENNVYTLFSGFDDDDNLIPNYYTTGSLDWTVPGQKKMSRIKFEGLITTSQSVKIQASFDGGDWVDVATIEGTGSYVDTGRTIAVGANTLGSKIAGGGATVFANPYQVTFKINTDRFQYMRLRYEALGGGYVSIHNFSGIDIRQKAGKDLPSKIY